MAPPPHPRTPSPAASGRAFDLIAHCHKDLVAAVAFNAYGDRCATGSVDGQVKVFNRIKDGSWRLCDHWGAHAGEITEMEWLPPTLNPNMLATLGIEGRFKMWVEDAHQPPGRRFSTSGENVTSFESGAGKHPFRSFATKYNEDTQVCYLAFISSDGTLAVHEAEQPEQMDEYIEIESLQALSKPKRGEETCFKVRFDPNPEPSYTALRAGMEQDALSLVVAGMTSVKVFRSRDTVVNRFGSGSRERKFYLAADIAGHQGLVRDVTWAPGNYRGYDLIATASQDGFVRVFRLDTPLAEDDGKDWSQQKVTGKERKLQHGRDVTPSSPKGKGPAHGLSGISTQLVRAAAPSERAADGTLEGQIAHTYREISKLDSNRSPLWRVAFDDDGQILGSVGDEGKLMCYRRTMDGTWAKSSELAPVKHKILFASAPGRKT